MSNSWLEFKFDIEPVAKQSVKISKYGNYTPKKMKETSNAISLMAKKQLPKGFELLKGPIIVHGIYFYFTPTKQMLKTKKGRESLFDGKTVTKHTKPDLDNLNKLVWDALEGIVFKNDSQICEIKNCVKEYCMESGIHIILSEKKECI